MNGANHLYTKGLNFTHMKQIENRMVVDSEWGEIEYGVKRPNLYQKKRQAYEEAEREETYHGFRKEYGNSKPTGRCD